MKQYDIGIDLGTSSIIIATEQQGVIFRQPSVGAVDTRCVIGRAVLILVPGLTADSDRREFGRIGTLA